MILNPMTINPVIPSYWYGLRGYYRMSETSGTVVAESYWGTAAGTRTTAGMANAGGINGYCNLFDAGTQAITYTNTYGFERTDPFSVSFWFKRVHAGIWGMLFGKIICDGSYLGWYILTRNTNVWGITLINSPQKCEVTGGMLSGTSIWYHCVTTYDGSSTAAGIKLYQNGVALTASVLQDDLTSRTILNTETANSGYKSGVGDPLDGYLDELAIWNRALTPSEAISLYNSGTGRFY